LTVVGIERPGPRPRGHALAVARVGFAAAAGLAAGVLMAIFGPPELAPLVGWDGMAVGWLALTILAIWPLNAEKTARRAVQEDPTRPVADVLLLAAAVASLAAVGVVLVRAGHSQGMAQALQVVLGIGSVVVSWALVHTTYILRYAQLYYSGPDGGIDFNQDEPPAYADFAYLAFTIGMTFQVSDTALQNRGIRRAALRHALLSYLFGTVIVAATVNLIAGLSK
jgi:uncharacterized membrane protein